MAKSTTNRPGNTSSHPKYTIRRGERPGLVRPMQMPKGTRRMMRAAGYFSHCGEKVDKSGTKTRVRGEAFAVGRLEKMEKNAKAAVARRAKWAERHPKIEV